MKKNYILAVAAMFLGGMLNAQIEQVTDINPTGDAGIGHVGALNGELYFEADAGDALGDELYKVAADGTVGLFKDINVDPEDSSPNSDPKYFTEIDGKLFFSANDGDNTGHDAELWVTDGTPEGTSLVVDLWPVATKGSNPLSWVIFDGFIYANFKTDTLMEFWKFNGTTDPVKVSSFWDDGLANPFYPVVDEENGIMYSKASNGKFELGVVFADGTNSIIDVCSDPEQAGYGAADDGIIFKGKYYFDGCDGVHGDELFVSEGTAATTKMVKDINVGDLASDSDPYHFAILGEELYFIAEVATGLQLWKTDGTETGTVMAFEPFAGGDGALDDLTEVNGTLVFEGTDGTNGIELMYFDGTNGGLLKDINDGGDSKPAKLKTIDGLVFFVAADETAKRLWVTDGTSANTVSVESLFTTTATPVDVNPDESVYVDHTFYFTGDDAEGDQIFSVDTRAVYEALGYTLYTVTFNVTDGTTPVADAKVEFDNMTAMTDASGVATFTKVKVANDQAYTVSIDNYGTVEETTSVVDQDVSVNVTLVGAKMNKVSHLDVYPNPSNGLITISGIEGDASYEVYNVSSQRVAEGKLIGSQLRLDVEAGLYILKMNTEQGTATSRIVIK